MNWRTELIITNAFFYKMWLITKKRVYHIFEILFWPAIALVSVGFMTRFLSVSPDVVAFILVGVIALSVVHLGQLDMSYLLLYSVWEKSLKQELAAPVETYHIVAGAWGIGVIHSIIVFCLLTLFSAYAFDYPLLNIGFVPVLLFFIGLTMMSSIIGILVCALSMIFGGRSHVVATSTVSVLTLVSGIYYPIDVLPESIQLISKAIPLTHFLIYYRSFYGFSGNAAQAIARGYFLAFLYFLIGLFLFSLALRYSRKQGILTRLSE